MNTQTEEWMRVERLAPKEIVNFIQEVFEIYEIRGQIDIENGIKFIIHTNERNHSIPHIHVEYGEYSVEIRIDNQQILSGNLPKKKQKFAQNWVKDNRERIENEWNDIAISAISHLTASRLDFKDVYESFE